MRTTNLSTDILLSLCTGPALLALLASRSMMSWMAEWGEMSEELFRGNRLPNLHVPLDDGDKAESEKAA